MKKLVSLVLCLAMLVTLTACSGGTNPAAAPVTTPASSGAETAQSANLYAVTEPVTIEFWNPLIDQVKADWLQDCAERFNASQDLITVELKQMNDYNSLNEQLSAAQAAGKGLPGVALINCPRVLTYADSGMIEPLNGYMDSYGFELEDYNSGMMNAMIPYGETEYFGIPWGISSSVCYWNMDILKQAGYDHIPETWAELKEIAPVILEKTGKKTIAFLSELNYAEVMLRNAGADPLGDGTSANLWDDNIVRFMKEYKQMIDAGQAEFVVGTDQNTNISTAFYSGELACMVNTSAVAHAAASQVAATGNFEVATSFAIQDVAEPALSCIAGAAIIVPAMNDQQIKNAAFQFIMFMTSSENVASWTSAGSVYPARLSVLNDAEVMQEIYEYEPLLEGIYTGLDGIVAKNKSPYQTSAYKVLLDAMGQYFYDDADFDTVWSNAETEINYILAGG